MTLQHEAGYMESDSQYRKVKEKHNSEYLVQTCIRGQWKYMVNGRRL